MSTQMKLIIPLLDGSITKDDITQEAGFVDAYNVDKNKPGNDNCIFLMYDCEKHGNKAYNRTVKFSKLKNLKSSRIIRVDNHPYILYTFTITNIDIKQFRKGLHWKSYKTFNRLVSFWGPRESDVHDALMFTWKPYDISYESVPEEDYLEELGETMCPEESTVEP